jgi:hypothetical protein
MGTSQTPPSEADKAQARRGKRLLFLVVFLFLALNAALLYKVFVSRH